ncbi:MAG TPA: TlpA disulfide reductase family protein, partial [Phycisphaerales bacterium]|nr:TlpA disulfide reductase family protein [Phycisphaerales bacterium]
MSLITRVALVTLAALLAAPALAQTKPASFPDEYYYRNNEGKRRPEYKKLEGKPVPAISVGDWIGSAVDVKDAKGKVVVIDFWATWCGPCMKSIPKNVELVDEFKDKGLVFVGVHDFNDGWDKAAAVVKSNKINYPVGRDATGGASQKRFGVISWPTYIVVDKFGIVRAAGLVPSRVRDVVSVLIDEPGPKPGEAGMSEFPADYYVAGSRRPKSLIDIEGKLLADLPAAT